MGTASAEMRVLPVRPVVGLAVVCLIAGFLAAMTAQAGHRYVELSLHLKPPFAPSLLYGCVKWMSWVVVTLALWSLANRWPIIFKPSTPILLAQFGASCAIAVAHAWLSQYTMWFASWYWPLWGRSFGTYSVVNIAHLGMDFVIYGFIWGVCAVLYSRMQTQQAIVERLEIERQLTQAQLQTLQTQVEPHFLFNTLNALASLVAQGRNREASMTLTHLETILSTTLERKAPAKVPFVEELRIVESYLAIQKVRFADRLEFNIEATPEALEGLVPCFVLQPIVENAIKHGIAPLEAGGRIETCVKRVGDTLWMRVRDNGCGLPDSSAKGHGIGIQNIRERLNYFYRDAYQFDAVALVEGGYQVTIQIPYERATG